MQEWTWPLAALYIASLLLGAHAQEPAAVAADTVTVTAGQELVVSCALPVGARAVWRLAGGRALPQDMTRSERQAGGGLLAELTASTARPHHAGLYECGGPRGVRVIVSAPAAPAAPAAADLHHHDTARARTTTNNNQGTQTAPATEAGRAGVDWDTVEEHWYNHTLSLTCAGAADSADNVQWTKNGTNINDIPDLKDRALLSDGQLLMTIRRAREEDYGNWTCSVGGVTRAWRVRSVLHAKLHAETSVVEGQRLKLTCKLVGRPYVPVDWYYKIENGELLVEAAQRSDAGRIMCVPRGPIANYTVPAVTTLRVKDMYAALWPFLGIVAEVVILCAVILVYERRRAQPTMDDSDTDHDTKKS